MRVYTLPSSISIYSHESALSSLFQFSILPPGFLRKYSSSMATETEIPVANHTKTLTLRSSDGQEFLVPESAAVLSITIKYMVEDDCAQKVIPIPNVDGKTLSRIIVYLKKHADEGVSDEEKREFDEEFVSGKSTDVLCDYVLAANYLNIKDLIDMVCKKIADMIRHKSVECIRKTFGIVNDFTPEEEEEMRREIGWAWEDYEPNDG